MAIAAYDSDLTSANSGLVDEALTVGNWDESSDAAWDDAGVPVAEGNFYIQGTDCISAQFTKTGVGTLLNDINQFAGAFTVDTDGAILIWGFWASPSSLTTYANGGVRTIVGDTLGDFYAFKASGSDFEPNPFGGWYNYAINPDVATIDTTVGTPDDTWAVVGLAINATAQSRGNPFAVDAIRVGRCVLEVIDGQAAAYGTFVGMASFDDSSGQRYALFQTVAGGYRWQGLMSLGVAATAVDFRDSDANIVIANTPMVSAAFNKIEVHHASSNVEWTAITINAYGVNDAIAATASAGAFEMIDNATVAKIACTFIDMLTFIYQSNATLTGCKWSKCGLVTVDGATFADCIFDNSTSSASLLAATLANITGCVFTSDGSNHAVELTSIGAGSMDWDNELVGYVAGTSGSPITPTSTGNEAIYVNVTTASDFTINVISGATVPSIRVSAGFTGNVNVIAGAVPLTVTVKRADTGAVIEDAWVNVEAGDALGDLFFEVVVTITASGTLATVAHTAHGLASGAKVNIRGAVEIDYTGVQTITVINANSYSYVMANSPTSPATGTINSTEMILSGLTSVLGVVTISRTYTVDQLYRGFARKTDASPFYKTSNINGTLDKDTGALIDSNLSSDE